MGKMKLVILLASVCAVTWFPCSVANIADDFEVTAVTSGISDTDLSYTDAVHSDVSPYDELNAHAMHTDVSHDDVLPPDTPIADALNAQALHSDTDASLPTDTDAADRSTRVQLAADSDNMGSFSNDPHYKMHATVFRHPDSETVKGAEDMKGPGLGSKLSKMLSGQQPSGESGQKMVSGPQPRDEFGHGNEVAGESDKEKFLMEIARRILDVRKQGFSKTSYIIQQNHHPLPIYRPIAGDSTPGENYRRIQIGVDNENYLPHAIENTMATVNPDDIVTSVDDKISVSENTDTIPEHESTDAYIDEHLENETSGLYSPSINSLSSQASFYEKLQPLPEDEPLVSSLVSQLKEILNSTSSQEMADTMSPGMLTTILLSTESTEATTNAVFSSDPTNDAFSSDPSDAVFSSDPINDAFSSDPTFPPSPSTPADDTASTMADEVASFLQNVASGSGFQGAFVGDLINNFSSLNHNAMKLLYNLLIGPLKASTVSLDVPVIEDDILYTTGSKDKSKVSFEPSDRVSNSIQSHGFVADDDWLPYRSRSRNSRGGDVEEIQVITAPPSEDFELVVGSSLNSEPRAASGFSRRSGVPDIGSLQMGMVMPPPEALGALPPGAQIILPSQLKNQPVLPRITVGRDNIPIPVVDPRPLKRTEERTNSGLAAFSVLPNFLASLFSSSNDRSDRNNKRRGPQRRRRLPGRSPSGPLRRHESPAGNSRNRFGQSSGFKPPGPRLVHKMPHPMHQHGPSHFAHQLESGHRPANLNHAPEYHPLPQSEVFSPSSPYIPQPTNFHPSPNAYESVGHLVRNQQSQPSSESVSQEPRFTAENTIGYFPKPTIEGGFTPMTNSDDVLQRRSQAAYGESSHFAVRHQEDNSFLRDRSIHIHDDEENFVFPDEEVHSQNWDRRDDGETYHLPNQPDMDYSPIVPQRVNPDSVLTPMSSSYPEDFEDDDNIYISDHPNPTIDFNQHRSADEEHEADSHMAHGNDWENTHEDDSYKVYDTYFENAPDYKGESPSEYNYDGERSNIDENNNEVIDDRRPSSNHYESVQYQSNPENSTVKAEEEKDVSSKSDKSIEDNDKYLYEYKNLPDDMYYADFSSEKISEDAASQSTQNQGASSGVKSAVPRHDNLPGASVSVPSVVSPDPDKPEDLPSYEYSPEYYEYVYYDEVPDATAPIADERVKDEGNRVTFGSFNSSYHDYETDGFIVKEVVPMTGLVKTMNQSPMFNHNLAKSNEHDSDRSSFDSPVEPIDSLTNIQLDQMFTDDDLPLKIPVSDIDLSSKSQQRINSNDASPDSSAAYLFNTIDLVPQSADLFNTRHEVDEKVNESPVLHNSSSPHFNITVNEITEIVTESVPSEEYMAYVLIGSCVGLALLSISGVLLIIKFKKSCGSRQIRSRQRLKKGSLPDVSHVQETFLETDAGGHKLGSWFTGRGGTFGSSKLRSNMALPNVEDLRRDQPERSSSRRDLLSSVSDSSSDVPDQGRSQDEPPAGNSSSRTPRDSVDRKEKSTASDVDGIRSSGQDLSSVAAKRKKFEKEAEIKHDFDHDRKHHHACTSRSSDFMKKSHEPYTTDSEFYDPTSGDDGQSSRFMETSHDFDTIDNVRGRRSVTTSQELGEKLSRDIRNFHERHSPLTSRDSTVDRVRRAAGGEESNLKRTTSEVSFTRDNVQNEVFLEFDNIFKQHGHYLTGPDGQHSTLDRASDGGVADKRSNSPDSIETPKPSHKQSSRGSDGSKNHRTRTSPHAGGGRTSNVGHNKSTSTKSPPTPPRFTPPPPPPRPPKPDRFTRSPLDAKNPPPKDDRLV